VKKILEQLLPQQIKDFYKDYKNKHHSAAAISQWKQAGSPVPPPHYVKQQVIAAYQEQSGYQVLIETGTYLGDMLFAQRDRFRKLYSIELSEALFAKARKRFKKRPHIQLVQGDSGTKIREILSGLDEPAIFWLDGHYSGGITALGDKKSPIEEELSHISARNTFQHLILIDDARGFDGADGYPTIPQMEEITRRLFPGYTMRVAKDIIQLLPPGIQPEQQ
jgi:hypothetical protein